MTWGGQFENQQRAMKRFSIVCANYPRGNLLAALRVPSSRRVSASVGFIALFGVAVLNGVVMVSYPNLFTRIGMLAPTSNSPYARPTCSPSSTTTTGIDRTPL